MKTTKKHFKLFCDEFKSQVERMGLMEWELRMFLADIGSNLASMSTDYSGRVCTVNFTEEWVDRLSLDDDQIRSCAKHEALELLIDDMMTLVRSPFVTQDELGVTAHTLVRRLEKLL